jgi:hypothetical protein
VQTTVEQRLKNSIANFLRSKEYSEQKAQARTALFCDDYEPRLSRLFLLERVELFMRTQERADARAAEAAERDDSPQLKFAAPGFAELFSGLQQRLPLKKGTMRIEHMTVTNLRESAAALRTRAKKRAEAAAAVDERRAKWLEAMAEAISPLAQTHHGIKVADYLELCEAGIVKGKAARG